MNDSTTLYWVAVNGPSVACCPVPIPLGTVRSMEGAICLPCPDWLVGFTTLDEATEAEEFLLTANIASEIPARQAEWCRRQDVVTVQIHGNQDPRPGGLPSGWLLAGRPARGRASAKPGRKGSGSATTAAGRLPHAVIEGRFVPCTVV